MEKINVSKSPDFNTMLTDVIYESKLTPGFYQEDAYLENTEWSIKSKTEEDALKLLKEEFDKIRAETDENNRFEDEDIDAIVNRKIHKLIPSILGEVRNNEYSNLTVCATDDKHYVAKFKFKK